MKTLGKRSRVSWDCMGGHGVIVAFVHIAISFFLFCIPLLTPHSDAVAQEWVDVTSQLSVDVGHSVRSRRSPNATITVEITNPGTGSIAGPLRLVLSGLSPDSVSLANAAGATAGGDLYLDLGPYAPDGLAPGAGTGPIRLTIIGGQVLFSFIPVVDSRHPWIPTMTVTVYPTAPTSAPILRQVKR